MLSIAVCFLFIAGASSSAIAKSTNVKLSSRITETKNDSLHSSLDNKVVTFHLYEIKLVDKIEVWPEGEADWYYHIGFSDDGVHFLWEHSAIPVQKDKDDLIVDRQYYYSTPLNHVFIAIMICEDDYISDDLADVSSDPLGGIDDYGNPIQPPSTGVTQGTYLGLYDVVNDSLSGNIYTVNGHWYVISGEYDGNTGDENDEEVWFFVQTSPIYHPPNVPTITGPAKAKIGVPTEYNFTTTDIDGDAVSYFIDWGDNSSSGWLGPYSSGSEITESHTWSKKGDYTIKAKAKDIYGNESEWGTLSVTMPLSYEPPHFRFFEWLFNRFPHAFPILRQLMG